MYLEEPRNPKGVYFAGRLGDYRYYNMDQAVASALKLFEEIVHGRRGFTQYPIGVPSVL